MKEGASNYSSNFEADERYARNEVLFGRTLVDYAEASGNAEAVKCAKATYYRFLLKWSVGKVKVARLGESLHDVMGERSWPQLLWGVPRWYAVLGMRMLLGRGVNL